MQIPHAQMANAHSRKSLHALTFVKITVYVFPQSLRQPIRVHNQSIHNMLPRVSTNRATENNQPQASYLYQLYQQHQYLHCNNTNTTVAVSTHALSHLNSIFRQSPTDNCITAVVDSWRFMILTQNISHMQLARQMMSAV